MSQVLINEVLRDQAARVLSGFLDVSTQVDLHRLPELLCGLERRSGERISSELRRLAARHGTPSPEPPPRDPTRRGLKARTIAIL